jgi:hypothetical protein
MPARLWSDQQVVHDRLPAVHMNQRAQDGRDRHPVPALPATVLLRLQGVREYRPDALFGQHSALARVLGSTAVALERTRCLGQDSAPSWSAQRG